MQQNQFHQRRLWLKGERIDDQLVPCATRRRHALQQPEVEMNALDTRLKVVRPHIRPIENVSGRRGNHALTLLNIGTLSKHFPISR